MACARRARFRPLAVGLLGALLALAACQTGTPTPPALLPDASDAATPTAQALAPTPPAPAPPGPASPTAARAASATAAPAEPAAGTPPVLARPVPVVAATSPGIIRFSSTRDPSGEVAIEGIRPDGTGRGTYTGLPGRPWAPRLSPDGAWLLFATAPPRATGRAQDLDLNGSGSPEIWIARPDGAGARLLIGGGGGYNGWAWSPDGRRIAFASDRAGSWDLYAIDPDGAGLARLTASPSQDGWPAWTPDGAALVFASTRSDRAQLYRVGAGGGAVARLLASPTSDTEPAVARDGRIAFSAQAPDGTGELAVLDPGGGAPRRLTARGGLNTSPAWSPDGGRLAFVGQRDGRSDLFAIGADGGGLRQLTTTGRSARPDWGPAPPDTLALRTLEQLARAVEGRRGGTLEGLVDDGRGAQSTIGLRFDLGDAGRPPRLQRATTTRGPGGERADEEIIIGDRAWRREGAQPWRAGPATRGVAEQVGALAPPLGDIREVTAEPRGLHVALHWHDGAGAEITLLVDAQRGLPLELRRIEPRTGASLTVRYDWDPPGAIEPPATP